MPGKQSFDGFHDVRASSDYDIAMQLRALEVDIAKILSDDNIEELLLYAAQTRNPRRNRVIAPLSVKAGLRAGEIAKLTWEMVIAPDGTINTVIELRNHAAKKAVAGSSLFTPKRP